MVSLEEARMRAWFKPPFWTTASIYYLLHFLSQYLYADIVIFIKAICYHLMFRKHFVVSKRYILLFAGFLGFLILLVIRIIFQYISACEISTLNVGINQNHCYLNVWVLPLIELFFFVEWTLAAPSVICTTLPSLAPMFSTSQRNAPTVLQPAAVLAEEAHPSGAS